MIERGKRMVLYQAAHHLDICRLEHPFSLLALLWVSRVHDETPTSRLGGGIHRLNNPLMIWPRRYQSTHQQARDRGERHNGGTTVIRRGHHRRNTKDIQHTP